LTSCFTGLDKSVLPIKTKIISCHTADSKPVKQEVNGTVMLPPLVFPGYDDLKRSVMLRFSSLTVNRNFGWIEKKIKNFGIDLGPVQ
jgi:hypothetical protein